MNVKKSTGKSSRELLYTVGSPGILRFTTFDVTNDVCQLSGCYTGEKKGKTILNRRLTDELNAVPTNKGSKTRYNYRLKAERRIEFQTRGARVLLEVRHIAVAAASSSGVSNSEIAELNDVLKPLNQKLESQGSLSDRFLESVYEGMCRIRRNHSILSSTAYGKDSEPFLKRAMSVVKFIGPCLVVLLVAVYFLSQTIASYGKQEIPAHVIRQASEQLLEAIKNMPGFVGIRPAN